MTLKRDVDNGGEFLDEVEIEITVEAQGQLVERDSDIGIENDFFENISLKVTDEKGKKFKLIDGEYDKVEEKAHTNLVENPE